MLYRLYVESKKNNANESIHKRETESQTRKANFRVPKGKGWGGTH